MTTLLIVLMGSLAFALALARTRNRWGYRLALWAGRVAGARASRKEVRKARASYGYGPLTWMVDDHIRRRGMEAWYLASSRVTQAVLRRVTDIPFGGR